jgi:hypothetical protein
MGFDGSLGGTLCADGTIELLRRWSSRRAHSANADISLGLLEGVSC